MNASDCLSLLRQAIIEGKEIALLDAQGSSTDDIQSAQSIQIASPSTIFALDIPTTYRHSTDPVAYYSLSAIYFAYLNRQLEHAEYFQECRRLGVPSVTLIYKRDLFAYLTGESETSANIEQQIIRSTSPMVDIETMEQSAAIAEIQFHIRERVLVDRNTITSAPIGTTKSFENIRKLAVDILLRGQRSSITSASPAVNSAAPSLSKSKSTPVSSAATLNSSMKSSTKLPSSNGVVASGSGGPSIIIVPAALTAPITLYNIKSLLETGKYNSMADLQKQGLPAKEQVVTVERKHPKTGVLTQYQIMDSVDTLTNNDWDRVVAVFASGQQWQFKGWRWEQPVDLFDHVKGFYLKYTDAQADAVVRGWNVTVLEINRYKRHLDMQCSHKFWTTLDQWLLSRKQRQ